MATRQLYAWLTSNFLTKNGMLFSAVGVISLPIAINTIADTVSASLPIFHPPKINWYHKDYFRSLDHASIRRGFQVYREVCASCHSMKLVTFHDFINVSHTEEELKAIASEYEIEDEPDDQGEVHPRPRTLIDFLPSPYQNDMQAMYMNGGLLPPDLSKIVISRDHNEDYIFSLLLGYVDPPEELDLKENQYYNLYFPGNIIGMAPPLSDGQVEYEDGTPATVSQMAKDLTIFLRFAAVTYYEDKQIFVIKGFLVLFPLLIASYWNYRKVFNILRTAKVAYKTFNWRK